MNQIIELEWNIYLLLICWEMINVIWEMQRQMFTSSINKFDKMCYNVCISLPFRQFSFLHIRQHYAVYYKSYNQLISIFTKFTKFHLLNLIFEYSRIFVYLLLLYILIHHTVSNAKFRKVLENWKRIYPSKKK